MQQENESYNNLLEKRNELDQKVTELETKINHMIVEQKKWEKSKETYPLCKELQSFVDRLRELPPVTFFPENGIHRLEVLERQILELTVEWESDQDKLRVARHELSILPIHGEMVEIKEEIEQLAKKGERWLEKQETLFSLQKEVSLLTHELQRQLLQLGPEWTKEILCKLDVSISKKELLRDHRQIFHGINTGLQAVEEMIQTKAVEREECEIQLGEVRQHLRMQETVEQLDQREDQLITLQQLQKEMKLEQEQKEWLVLQLGIHPPQKGQGFNWLALLLPLLGIAGSVLLSQAYGVSWGAGIPFIVGLIAFTVMYWMGSKRRKNKDPENDQMKLKIRELERSIEEKKQQSTKLVASLQGLFDFTHIQNQLNQIRLQRASSLKWSEKQAWLEEKESQVEKEWKKLIHRKESLLEQKREEENRWSTVLKNLRFPSGLTPDGALDMLSLATKAKEGVERLELENVKIRSLQQEWTSFQQQIEEIYERVGIPRKSDDLWILHRDLQEIGKEQVELLHKKKEWEKSILEIEESRDKKERWLKKLEEERVSLFKQVSVEDSEAFRTTYRLYLERKNIRREDSDARTRIRDSGCKQGNGRYLMSIDFRVHPISM